MRKNKLATVLGLLICSSVPVSLIAAYFHVSPIGWGWYQPYDTEATVALSGYDPVAYHSHGRAMKGSTSHAVRWAEATWYFISAESKELFLDDPLKYAPQFGGHCAVAVHSGTTARADPEQWIIREGKLYVFFGEEPKLEFLLYTLSDIAKAEHNWNSERD